MTTVLLKQLLVPQPVKKYSAFYRTWRFITVFIIARHLPIYWARLIHLTLSNPISLRSNSTWHSHLRRYPSKCPSSQEQQQRYHNSVSQFRHSCATGVTVYRPTRLYATCTATPAPHCFNIARYVSLSTLRLKFHKPFSLPKVHKCHQVQICLKNCLAPRGFLFYKAHSIICTRQRFV